MRTRQRQSGAEVVTVETLTYDGDGRVRYATDAEGNTAESGYDPDGRVVLVRDPTGRTVETEYDLLGRRLSESFTYGFDDPAHPTDAVGVARRLFAYDHRPDPVAATDATGATTRSGYDVFGRLVEATDATGATTRYGYDRNGNRTSVTDPAGNTTETVYDTFDRPTRVVGPDPDGGGAESKPARYVTYDGAGRVVSETAWVRAGEDPAAFTTEYGYDPAGNRTRALGPAPSDGAGRPETTWTYNEAGQVTTVTDPVGRTTTSGYWQNGWLASSKTPSATQAETYSYDPAGRRVTRTDPAGQTWQTSYLRNGWVQSETTPDPDGPGPQTPSTTSYTYTGTGDPKTTTDPLGRTTTHFYDLAGRRRAIQTAGGAQAWFTYDAEGRVAESRVPVDTDTTHDHTKTFRYTPRGDLGSWTDGEGGTTSYTYDTVGQLETVTDPRGSQVRYSYDRAGRRTGRANRPTGGTETVTDSYSYDPRNQTVKATARTAGGDVTTQVAYDRLGRITETSQGGATSRYSWDLAGRVAERSDAAGTTVLNWDNSCGPTDPCGQLEAVDEPLTGGSYTYTYNPQSGRPTGRREPSGAEHAYSYDNLGRPTTTTTATGGREQVRYQLAYDPAGNVTSQTSTIAGNDPARNGTQRYTYTADNQLAGWTRPDRTTTRYGYDPAGNLSLTQVDGQPAAATVFDRADRPQQTTQGTNLTRYTWDPAGNLTQTSQNGQTTATYTYDAYERQTTATVTPTSGPGAGQTTTIAYSYDALDRTTKRHQTSPPTGTTTTGYTYDGLSHEPVRITDTTTRLYTYAQTGQALAQQIGATTLTPGFNHRGDLTHTLDQTGRTADIRDYTPWGQTWGQTGTTALDLGYQNDVTDPTTGQVDMGARNYQPTLPAFTTQDPIEYLDTTAPTSLNLHAYAANNPITNTDPDGHLAVSRRYIDVAARSRHSRVPKILRAWYRAKRRGHHRTSQATRLAGSTTRGSTSSLAAARGRRIAIALYKRPTAGGLDAGKHSELYSLLGARNLADAYKHRAVIESSGHTMDELDSIFGLGLGILLTALNYARYHPIVGPAIAAFEVTTGKDMTTGEKLSTTRRIVTGAILAAPAVAGSATKALTAATKTIRNVRPPTLQPAPIPRITTAAQKTAGIADDTFVVRGGTNTPERIAGGSGVTTDAAGNAHGVSVNTGRTLEEAAQGIPHKQVGVTAARDIRAAGGSIKSDPLPGNPLHCLVGGISAEALSGLMTPTVKNPCV